jgi:hypothetical protein
VVFVEKPDADTQQEQCVGGPIKGFRLFLSNIRPRAVLPAVVKVLGNVDHFIAPQTPPVDHQFVLVCKPDLVDSIRRLAATAANLQMAIAHEVFIAWGRIAS